MLEVIACGGQPLNATHLAALGTVTRRIHVGYGSTETGLIAWRPVGEAASYESCNNGPPYEEGVEVKVVDEGGGEVGAGRLGEVLVRSEQAFLGYLNNHDPDAPAPGSSKTLSRRDGWVSTGDVGSLNERGEVSVFCRKGFSIMRGAYLLHPGWLESRLLRCPGVLHVLIVPVPDPVLHQELCACVVTRPGGAGESGAAAVTAESVKEFCAGLFLGDGRDPMTAVPRHLLFLRQLPTTPTGKTCRRSTAALAARRLGLQE